MEQQPTFHETYSGLVAGLPPSQLREAHKRLSKCKQPLTDEEIVSQHPRVQACLEKISAAYSRKKTRSAVSSKARRDAVRTTAADALTDVQEAPPFFRTVESEPAVCEIADLTASLEAATVECSSVEPAPVEPVEPKRFVESEPAYEAPPPTIEVKPSRGVPKKSPLRRAPAEPAEPSSRPPLLVHAKKAAVVNNSLVSRRD